MTEELCKALGYWAFQDSNMVVTLLAWGVHHTDGYDVFLEKTDESPSDWPEYVLKHVVPEPPVLEVITPFAVLASFEASAAIRSVIVHDADGQRPVPVNQVPACEG
jgi:hypothetical protein